MIPAADSGRWCHGQLGGYRNDEIQATLTYRWHADGGTFSDNDVEDPTWTAPAAQSVPRSYTLTLIVTDSGDLTGSDAITITVTDDSTEPDPNTAPTVTITLRVRTTVAGGAEVNLTSDRQ